MPELTYTLTRVIEPSRIRRGRKATRPVWYVDTADGSRWKFYRQKDAVAFIGNGCACPQHEQILCRCGGVQVRSLSDAFGKWPGDETDEQLAAALKRNP